MHRPDIESAICKTTMWNRHRLDRAFLVYGLFVPSRCPGTLYSKDIDSAIEIVVVTFTAHSSWLSVPAVQRCTPTCTALHASTALAASGLAIGGGQLAALYTVKNLTKQ